MDNKEIAMEMHRQWKGKLEVTSRVSVSTKDELAIAYTPGVAEPCIAIQKDVDLSYELTRRWNTVAVITDGTAVLGLGDIGPEAAMPVMEGKCILFKSFGDIDAIPLCIRSKDVDEIVKTISLLAGSWGGINLEDISAPRCFEIEKKLQEVCDIPVFHDDQHGTAVVVVAGLKNALKRVGKQAETTKAVISGAGAAGTSIAKLMLQSGFNNIIMVDRAGALSSEVTYDHAGFNHIAQITNPNKMQGSLAEVLKDADIFIGVSAPGIVTEEMVRSMAKDSIVFAMANPVPEIMPELARKAGSRIIATGRSDYPNQINNVLAFPGIFRGALDVRAAVINDEMKMAAAEAIASMIATEELMDDYIIPSSFDERVVKNIAKAVAEAAQRSGVARLK